jgi:hypothetical protein
MFQLTFGPQSSDVTRGPFLPETNSLEDIHVEKLMATPLVNKCYSFLCKLNFHHRIEKPASGAYSEPVQSLTHPHTFLVILFLLFCHVSRDHVPYYVYFKSKLGYGELLLCSSVF